MERKLLHKMIRNCFLQYQHSVDSIPLNEQDYNELCDRIENRRKEENSDIYEIVEDVVYEYLST